MFDEDWSTFWVFVPTALLAIGIWFQRYFILSRCVAIVASIALVCFVNQIPFSVALQAPILSDLTDVSLILLLWICYGHACCAAGGIRRAGPYWLYPFLCGVLMGEWGAALFFAASVRQPSTMARLILAASAGAFIGVLGKPALLLLGMNVNLIPLAVLLSLFCVPRKDDVLALPNGSWSVTFICVLTWLGSFYQPLWSLGFGLLFLSPLAWSKISWKALQRDIGLVFSALCLASLAAINGMVELGAWHLEGGVLNTQGEIRGPIFYFFAFLSSLADPLVATFYAEAFMDRALDLDPPTIKLISLGGASIGGTCFLLSLHRGLRAAKERFTLYMFAMISYWSLLIFSVFGSQT